MSAADSPADTPAKLDGKIVVLYDGVCGLCNTMVRFLLRRDRHDRFRFAPIQSDFGRAQVTSHGGDPDDLRTIYVIDSLGTPDERVRVRGRAILHCAPALGGAWKLLGVFRILPTFLIDAGYLTVARLRYRLFGKHDTCPLPSTADRAKFIATA